MYLLLLTHAFAAPTHALVSPPPAAGGAVATPPVGDTSTLAAPPASAPTVPELLVAYGDALRRGLLTPSPATHLELARLAIALAEAGEPELDGRPTLVRAGGHLGDLLVSNELRSPDGPPAAWLQPAWATLDALLSTAADAADPGVALHVQATAARVALRFRRVASDAADQEGWPGSEWHHEADRLESLFPLDPGSLSLPSHLWVAETRLATCSDGYAAGAGGFETVLVQLRALHPASAAASRRVARAWAAHHDCALEWRVAPPTDAAPAPDWVAARLDHAERLVQAALDGVEADELRADGDVSWWLEIGFTTLLDTYARLGDDAHLLDVAERMLAPRLVGAGWTGRALAAFNGAIRARQLTADRKDLSLATLRERFARADDTTDRAFEQLYRTDLGATDADGRQLLLDALQTYADVNLHYRDMPDRAARAEALAERVRALPDAAPVAPPAPTATPAPPWPDAVAVVLEDVRTLAAVAIDAELPGDLHAQRFAGRAWVLRELDALVGALDRRARLPGALGDDARAAHVEALGWTAVAHAAAGDPGGAALLLAQIDGLDPAAADLVLPGREAPRAWVARVSAAAPAEVRPLVLKLPSGGPPVGLAGPNPDPVVSRLAEADLAAGYRAWLGPSAVSWTVAWAPLGDAVTLGVGRQEVSLDPGAGPVVGRLEPLGAAWVIAPEPAPLLPAPPNP